MAYAPMNTMSAFELAVTQGAAGIELDVQLSRDGQAVVIHDFSIDATTNGEGMVADYTLAELKSLDAGGWFSNSYCNERIPTLDEVFQAFGKKILINVELKTVSEEDNGLEEAVAACIERHQVADRVIISSFNPSALGRFSALRPDIMLGFLYVPGIPDDSEALGTRVPHHARHPWHEMIDADYMSRARDKGYYVNAWTVNDPQRAQELKRLAVNAIITDMPDVIIAALEEC